MIVFLKFYEFWFWKFCVFTTILQETLQRDASWCFVKLDITSNQPEILQTSLHKKNIHNEHEIAFSWYQERERSGNKMWLYTVTVKISLRPCRLFVKQKEEKEEHGKVWRKLLHVNECKKTNKMLENSSKNEEDNHLRRKEKNLQDSVKNHLERSPFFIFLMACSCSSTAAPSSVKMMPAWELTPTAVTTILPLPSMTCVPDSNMGSNDSPFFTWSDSPVREDSSI